MTRSDKITLCAAVSALSAVAALSFGSLFLSLDRAGARELYQHLVGAGALTFLVIAVFAALLCAGFTFSKGE